MTITLATTPTYALPGRVEVTATITGSTRDYVRLWCTAAPLGSVMDKLLQDAGKDAGRVEVAAVDSGAPFELNLDKGGEYVFVGQEYTKGVTGSQGGGFAGDERSYTTETKGDAEQSLKLHVGQRMAHQVGTPAHGTATLLVYVWDETIRETTLATHGIETPALVRATTPQALSAARSVQAKVDAFVDATVDSLTSNVDAVVAELITEIGDHMRSATFHNSSDATNEAAVSNLPPAPATAVGYAIVARVLARRLRLHALNEEDGSANYHDEPDPTNAPLVRSTSDSTANARGTAATWAAIGDVVRCYEAHRDSSVHPTPDTTNVLTESLGPLLDLHRAFLAELATFSPTPPDGVSAGVVKLANLGFGA